MTNNAMHAGICASVLTALALLANSAHAASPPNTISPPKGLNLGSTSFFDAFARQTEGWSLVEYDRYEDLNSINNAQGKPNPLFRDPHVTVFVALTQVIYTSNLHPFGDTLAFSAALPIVNFDAHFNTLSPVKLPYNGLNIGDLVWGPIYQSKVYKNEEQRPVFVWRAQFIVSSPTGPVNDTKSLNAGVGYWAINPYVTFTYLPTSKIEISNRFNYQYNFEGTQFSNPPAIPHFVYHNGQAGQIIYDNFAASYAVTPSLNIGFNSYYLFQLNPNKTNGLDVSKSRETEVYMGPGAHYQFDESNGINFNAYFKVISNNATSGPQFNVQYVHRF